MKKVGIVSCYFKHNYGSMLQAYATQMILDEWGIENETIDITGFDHEIKKAKIKYFLRASLTSDILIEKAGMACNLIKKKNKKSDYGKQVRIRGKKFNEFKDTYFRLSEPYASKLELGEKSKDRYSDVIVGSDQLWLPANIEADYYTLNFVPDEVNKISYATSFGMSCLPKGTTKKAGQFLKRMDHISVREETGRKLVKELSGRDASVVCDPTLLFEAKDWDKLCTGQKQIKEPYIFCYFLGNNPGHREFVKRLRKESGCKVVALLHLDQYIKSDCGYADETPYDVGPAEFVELIKGAQYVCTDSFHASVFSILNSRKFFVFKRFARDTKQSTNSRIDTLLSHTGLNSRLVTGEENVKECMERAIDYREVHTRLGQLRQESKQYLKTALNHKGN